MWQKTFAGICVMTGAFGFGYALCQEMNNVLFNFKEQKRMLLYIINEISFMHRPMEEIFRSLEERLKDPYKVFVSKIAERMEIRSGKTLYEIWCDEVRLLQKSGECPKAAAAMLLRIGESFGCDGDKMQIDALRLIEAELSGEIESMLRENEDKSKLIKTLSVLAGLFCIVLLI